MSGCWPAEIYCRSRSRVEAEKQKCSTSVPASSSKLPRHTFKSCSAKLVSLKDSSFIYYRLLLCHLQCIFFFQVTNIKNANFDRSNNLLLLKYKEPYASITNKGGASNHIHLSPPFNPLVPSKPAFNVPHKLHNFKAQTTSSLLAHLGTF